MTQVMRHVSSVCIPNSLRTIGPFLEEAQSIMREKGSRNQKVIIYCIDHALKLVGQFGLIIGNIFFLCYICQITNFCFCVTKMFDKISGVDEAAETVLDLFRERRDEIAREIDYPELDLEGIYA